MDVWFPAITPLRSIRFVPFDLRHLRNNLSKHPPRCFNRFLRITSKLTSKVEETRIRINFIWKYFSSLFLPPSLFFFYLAFFISRLLLVRTVASFDVCEMEGLLEVKKNRKDLGRDRWRTVSRNISNACCLVTNTVSPSMFTVLCCARRGNSNISGPLIRYVTVR